ncbi:hypothetical protein [Micromonospora sp. NBRC 101691]|uniref:hypothetical protein n=1 Tax=Micromonospora sp. NBRC 101691 TaxID=3032198 RepID=UPI0024A3FBA7|nr:hypothetical protein [Micromonospora sp. NBRC 101691]GLY25530.1 hypothetical protein Misp04_52610 [Micromonospora sp. NBRC 101691]
MRANLTRWLPDRSRWWRRPRRRELRRIESRIDEAVAALRALGVQVAALQESIDRRAESVAGAGGASGQPADGTARPAGAPAGEPPGGVRELVTIADRLADLTSRATPTDPAQAAAVLRWLDRQLPAVMEAAGLVAIADPAGPVDLDRHEVVASRPGPVDTEVIAETVRVGYLWRGSLLRTQQVVTTHPDAVGCRP